MALILLVSPYVRKGDDRLALLAQANLMLLAMMGLTLEQSEVVVLDDTTDILLSVLLIVSISLMVATAFVMIIRNAHKICQHHVRKRKYKKQPSREKSWFSEVLPEEQSQVRRFGVPSSFSMASIKRDSIGRNSVMSMSHVERLTLNPAFEINAAEELPKLS